MREILITISNNRITASNDIAGYQGEHNAATLKFELPTELQQSDYTYKVNITLPDGITATADITDMSLKLTQEVDTDNTLVNRISKLEEQNKILEQQSQTNADDITNLQEAICEVYESII